MGLGQNGGQWLGIGRRRRKLRAALHWAPKLGEKVQVFSLKYGKWLVGRVIDGIDGPEEDEALLKGYYTVQMERPRRGIKLVDKRRRDILLPFWRGEYEYSRAIYRLMRGDVALIVPPTSRATGDPLGLGIGDPPNVTGAVRADEMHVRPGLPYVDFRIQASVRRGGQVWHKVHDKIGWIVQETPGESGDPWKPTSDGKTQSGILGVESLGSVVLQKYDPVLVLRNIREQEMYPIVDDWSPGKVEKTWINNNTAEEWVKVIFEYESPKNFRRKDVVLFSPVLEQDCIRLNSTRNPEFLKRVFQKVYPSESWEVSRRHWGFNVNHNPTADPSIWNDWGPEISRYYLPNHVRKNAYPSYVPKQSSHEDKVFEWTPEGTSASSVLMCMMYGPEVPIPATASSWRKLVSYASAGEGKLNETQLSQASSSKGSLFSTSKEYVPDKLDRAMDRGAWSSSGNEEESSDDDGDLNNEEEFEDSDDPLKGLTSSDDNENLSKRELMKRMDSLEPPEQQMCGWIHQDNESGEVFLVDPLKTERTLEYLRRYNIDHVEYIFCTHNHNAARAQELKDKLRSKLGSKPIIIGPIDPTSDHQSKFIESHPSPDRPLISSTHSNWSSYLRLDLSDEPTSENDSPLGDGANMTFLFLPRIKIPAGKHVPEHVLEKIRKYPPGPLFESFNITKDYPPFRNRTKNTPESVFPPPINSKIRAELIDAGIDIDNTSSPSFQEWIKTPILPRYRKWFAGQMKRFEHDFMVKDGDILNINNLKVYVVGTPGHSWDHVSYWIPSRSIAFTGDAMHAKGIGRKREAPRKYMYESLRLLAGLPANTQIFASQTLDPKAYLGAMDGLAEDGSIRNKLKKRAAYLYFNVHQRNETYPDSYILDERRYNPFLHGRWTVQWAG